MASFLDLPGELRNQIYELTLVVRPPIDTSRIRRTTWAVKYLQRSQISGLGMLATCRQVRSEAIPYFYGKNEFTLRLRDFDNHFLENLTNDALPKLENCRLRWPLGTLLHRSHPEIRALDAIIVVDEISKLGRVHGRKGLKIEAVWTKWFSGDWTRICETSQFCCKVEDGGSWWVSMRT